MMCDDCDPYAQAEADELAEMEASALAEEITRLRATLTSIAERPWVENTLDPQWAPAQARAALAHDARPEHLR